MVAILIGLGICVFTKYRKEQTRLARARENELKVELTTAPDKIFETSDPVFFQGQCIVDGPVSDAKFGIVTREHPIMFRDVEVFCWTERVSTVEEKRGNSVRNVNEYHYEAKWVPGHSFIDSRNFKDQQYNLNVAPDIKDERLANSYVRVGT